jgi:hypothetical protein
MSTEEIDPAEFERIARVLANVARGYLGQPPHGPRKVFTMLNALAGLSGVIIAGTGADSAKIRGWFVGAVDAEIAGLADPD